MTAETLASILASALSLGFAYIPGLKAWYDGLESQYKAVVMGAGLLAVTLAVFGLACAGLGADFGVSVTCDKTGIVELVKVLFSALGANQGTFLLLVKPFKK